MDKEKIKKMALDERFISGIYNYCDRWCERCTQTSRCLNYAMGEEEYADPMTRDIRNKEYWEKLSDIFKTTLELLDEMAAERGIDLNAIDHGEYEEKRRTMKITAKNHQISRLALAYTHTAEDWFKEAKSLFGKDSEEETGSLPSGKNANPATNEVKDALEAINWYRHQIYVKMIRAISGRVEEKKEVSDDIEVFPKDSDGSAKVALIGIDRSIAAWSIVNSRFPSFRKLNVQDILIHLERLRRKIEKDFPDARGFIRPGFDSIDYNS